MNMAFQKKSKHRKLEYDFRRKFKKINRAI